MASLLVLVLALVGFVLLVLGERMGLAQEMGLFALRGLFGLVFLSLGFAGVTSRFEIFAGSAPSVAGVGAVVARGACVLVLLAGFLPGAVPPAALAAGFAAGMILGLGPAERASPLARFARLGAGLTMLALVLVLLTPLRQGLDALLPAGGVAGVLLGVIALVVLLPGGLLGATRVQKVVLALALVLVLAPLGFMLSVSAGSLPARLPPPEAIGRLLLGEGGQLQAAGLQAAMAGFAAGLAARGTAALSPLRALSAPLAALVIAGGLALLHGFAQGWLAHIVGDRILGVAPTAWPDFVFDEEIRGWVRACGLPATDPQAVARACGLASSAVLPPTGQVGVAEALWAPALARANRLPALLGEIWAMLPLLIGGAGFLTLLHGAATAMSEALLFGTLNPGGLRSWRLAMARLTLLTLVIALLALPASALPEPSRLAAALGLALGVALVLRGLAQVARPATEKAA